MWGEDPEPYLAAGVNLVPLAPLANVTVEELPGLVARMSVRINSELRTRSLKLWTATYLLMGLCYSEELVSRLLEGVHNAGIDDLSGDFERRPQRGARQ